MSLELVALATMVANGVMLLVGAFCFLAYSPLGSGCDHLSKKFLLGCGILVESLLSMYYMYSTVGIVFP